MAVTRIGLARFDGGATLYKPFGIANFFACKPAICAAAFSNYVVLIGLPQFGMELRCGGGACLSPPRGASAETSSSS